jgi:hypothetical protein
VFLADDDARINLIQDKSQKDEPIPTRKSETEKR